MSVTLDADSPQAKQLELLVKNRIASFGIDEDLDFVAQYIVVMVTNGKEQSNIAEELSGLFGDKFNDDFSRWLFEAASSVVNGAANQSQSQPPANQSQQFQDQQFQNQQFQNQQFQDQQQQHQQQQFNGNYQDPSFREYKQDPGSLSQPQSQYDPSGMSSRFNPKPINLGRFNTTPNRSSGGISKRSSNSFGTNTRGGRGGFRRGGGNDNGFSIHMSNSPNAHNILDPAAIGAMGTGLTVHPPNGNDSPFQLNRPKLILERCKNWPNCTNSPCEYVHPSRPCRMYPGCPNAPGTCRFVHMGEDSPPPMGFRFPLPSPEILDQVRHEHEQFLIQQKNLALIAQQSQDQYGQNQDLTPQNVYNPHQQQKSRQYNNVPRAPAIVVCKFTDKCVNRSCPCGHPTPSNDDAKVTTLEWCAASKDCTDTNCDKAHPSGSLTRAPAPLPTEKLLDACKFGARCTNNHCRYRHATSPVMCRDGEACTRIDCMFTHPTSQQCKFGVNCKNPNCRFQHPEGHGRVSSSVWVKNGGADTTTSERKFAEPEDQVMETIVPGSEQAAT